MSKKSNVRKSDQDSSSEEQEKKRSATVDVDEACPTLLEGNRPKIESSMITKTSTLQISGDKQEEKNDEASSEIDSSSSSESVSSGIEGSTTMAEQDNKYEADIPEVTVVLEDIKQFEEHCRVIPYNKVSVI